MPIKGNNPLPNPLSARRRACVLCKPSTLSPIWQPAAILHTQSRDQPPRFPPTANSPFKSRGLKFSSNGNTKCSTPDLNCKCHRSGGLALLKEMEEMSICILRFEYRRGLCSSTKISLYHVSFLPQVLLVS